MHTRRAAHFFYEMAGVCVTAADLQYIHLPRQYMYISDIHIHIHPHTQTCPLLLETCGVGVAAAVAAADQYYVHLYSTHTHNAYIDIHMNTQTCSFLLETGGVGATGVAVATPPLRLPRPKGVAIAAAAAAAAVVARPALEPPAHARAHTRTNTHVHTHTHAHTHTHMHTHAHMRTHAHTHMHKNTRMHTKEVVLSAIGIRNILEPAAFSSKICSKVLQYVAVCCTRCNTLQHTATQPAAFSNVRMLCLRRGGVGGGWHQEAGPVNHDFQFGPYTCCSVLRCVAV